MKLSRILTALFVSLILVWILLREISLGLIWDTLGRLDVFGIVLALALYICINLARGLRFFTLLGKKIKFFRLFSIISMHNLANVVMPVRSGELSYVFFTRKDGVDTSEGFGTLLLARLFDVASILLVFVLAYVLFESAPKETFTILFWFFLVVVLGFLFMFCLIVFKSKLGVLFGKVLDVFNLRRFDVIKKVQEKVGQIIDVIRTIGFSKLAFLILIESLLIWGLMFYFSFYVLNLLGLEVGFLETVLGIALIQALLVLPIYGVLGFGTMEAAFTIGFLILGFEKELVIAVGFSHHILTLFFAFVVGLFGFLIYRKTTVLQPSQ
tara:strand:+ start:4674 stop:5648 length:975 start_codon:yes stop_codon:yes gene_type:complete